MTHRLDELSWEGFRDRVRGGADLVLVPVGTLEAHGGLPLGTDTIIPTALAADLAPRLQAMVAPAVPYGVTNSLLPYPGSTTVSSATFVAYLYEACAGLADAGLRRIVLLNGHGGQTREVHEVVTRLWDGKRVFAAAVEWWGMAEALSREVYGEVTSGHAGVEETAMVLAAAPATVDRERAAAARRLPRRPGVKARPFPATVMLEREETPARPGAPVLDEERARRFYGGVADAVESVVREVLEGWEALRR